MPADGLESEEDNEPVSTGYQPEQVKEAAGHARLRPGSRGEEDRGGRVVVVDQHYFIFSRVLYQGERRRCPTRSRRRGR